MVAVELPEVALMVKGPALVVPGRVAFHWQALLPGGGRVKSAVTISILFFFPSLFDTAVFF